MAKILIIDKDQMTIQSLVYLLRDLQLEAEVVHSWPSHTMQIDVSQIEMIFVNVEMPGINLQQLYTDFPQRKKNSVPKVFLFKRTFDPRYVKAKQYPYLGDLKKPIMLQEVYKLISDNLTLDAKPARQNNYMELLNDMKNFESNAVSWIENLKAIMAKENWYADAIDWHERWTN